MKKGIFVCMLVLILVFVGCEQKIVCNKPYILVGSECCLDNDYNDICDKDEGGSKTTGCREGTSQGNMCCIGGKWVECEQPVVRCPTAYCCLPGNNRYTVKYCEEGKLCCGAEDDKVGLCANTCVAVVGK